MGVSVLVQALVAALPAAGVADPLAGMTPREKAAMVVVSGLPAPEGVAGVIVQRSSRGRPWPRGPLVLVDQEGGDVRAFPELPPSRPASAYRSPADARAAGRATGAALRVAGVHVDLAPVLDEPDGPLGARHYRRPELALAFARGLADEGVAACVKHFPGLGSTAVSTDDRPHVAGRVRDSELAAFREAIRAGVACVMVGHAFYPSLGRFRASLEPETYRLLREELGFDGVIVTDSLNIVREPPAYWPVRAIRAGADLLLFTSAAHARRAIERLLPLARRGELDEHVLRVLELRARFRG